MLQGINITNLNGDINKRCKTMNLVEKKNRRQSPCLSTNVNVYCEFLKLT